MSQHEHWIRPLVSSLVKDKSSVEDIVQNLYLSLLRSNLPSGSRRLKRYIYRMVTNDVIDAYRRNRRQNEALYRFCRDNAADFQADSAAKMLADAEERDKMFACLREVLPPRQARAVILRFWTGLDNEEVARKMGMKARSVDRCVFRALKKLRKILRDGKGDETIPEGLFAPVFRPQP